MTIVIKSICKQIIYIVRCIKSLLIKKFIFQQENIPINLLYLYENSTIFYYETDFLKKIGECLRTDHLKFIQIGANDGVRNDHLHSYIKNNPLWSGVLVEPIPENYAKLVRNYSDLPNCETLQAALSSKTGTCNLYSVSIEAGKDPEMPWWYDQIASMDRNHIIKHLGEKAEPYIVIHKVPSYSVADFLKFYHVQTIDFLYIDTEGMDASIALGFIKENKWPTYILLEYKHCSITSMLLLLSRLYHKYYIYYEFNNLLAVSIEKNEYE